MGTGSCVSVGLERTCWHMRTMGSTFGPRSASSSQKVSRFPKRVVKTGIVEAFAMRRPPFGLEKKWRRVAGPTRIAASAQRPMRAATVWTEPGFGVFRGPSTQCEQCVQDAALHCERAVLRDMGRDHGNVVRVEGPRIAGLIDDSAALEKLADSRRGCGGQDWIAGSSHGGHAQHPELGQDRIIQLDVSRWP